MEATDFSFVSRSNHRPENGGYEEWSFKINDQKFSLFCDLRIPGIVSPYYEDMPSDKSRVCMVDIIFTTSKNIADIYDPSQSTAEVQEAVIAAAVKILLEKIKPIRDFKYVNFVFDKRNKTFFEQLFNQICIEGSAELKQSLHRIINPEAQLLIDAGQLEFLAGTLK